MKAVARTGLEESPPNQALPIAGVPQDERETIEKGIPSRTIFLGGRREFFRCVQIEIRERSSSLGSTPLDAVIGDWTVALGNSYQSLLLVSGKESFIASAPYRPDQIGNLSGQKREIGDALPTSLGANS